MNNLLIRIEMTKHNLKQWQLADILGISEFSLSRKLRKELPELEQERIISLIQNYADNQKEV